MKKILLLSLLAFLVTLFIGCSKPTKWTQVQRDEFITSLDPYRDMIYLNEFNDGEFVIFTTSLSSGLEVAYPVYTEFVVMPALSDTLDMWVVESIVEQLDTDASNMRYLYPYRSLVMQGVLPSGLDHTARNNFYRCLAQKVNAHFSSIETFFYAVITNSIEPNLIATMQSECATDLFDFTRQEVELTIEANN
ncbi:MAG: hypothetical protein SNH94_05580 [Rikenellaceae bacterium]